MFESEDKTGVTAWAVALKASSSITKLNLAQNCIDSDDAKILAPAISDMRALASLNLASKILCGLNEHGLGTFDAPGELRAARIFSTLVNSQNAFGVSSIASREGMEEGEQATADVIVTLRIHQSADVVEKQCRCRLYLLKSSKWNCSRLLGFDEECNNDICVNHRLRSDHVWCETSTGAAGCDWSLSAWDYSSGKKKSLLIVCTFPSADVCKRFRQAHSDARPLAVGS
jgi:hypothetical protein